MMPTCTGGLHLHASWQFRRTPACGPGLRRLQQPGRLPSRRGNRAGRRRAVRPEDITEVTRYAFEAVLDGRLDLDAGVLVLPRTVSELTR